jgi:hypothetical protein
MMVKVSLPQQRTPPPDAVPITFWVIYDRPKDYPQGCVLRAQWGKRGDPDATIADAVAWYAPTIDELRAILPFGVTRIGPSPQDDPCIAEVWMA